MAEPRPQRLFDRRLLDVKRNRAQRIGDQGAGYLLARALEDLDERLASVKRDFRRVAVIGRFWSGMETVIRNRAPDAVIDGIDIPDTETLEGERGSYDLAISLYEFHLVDDLPGLLIQTRLLLKPDGLLIACLSGAGTLAELRDTLLASDIEASGGAVARVAPLVDVRDMGHLLQRAGLALPVADLDTVTVRHGHLLGLISDLRAMGCTSILKRPDLPMVNREWWAKAAAVHAEKHAQEDGRIPATFVTLWISGWSPDAGQPKPLKPGSAQVSLASVLGNAADTGSRD